MKIINKVILFMIMVNLCAILIGGLGVFPEGAIRQSEFGDLTDSQGKVTADSVANVLFGDYKINITILDFKIGIPMLRVSWANIVLLFTGIILSVAFVMKNSAPVAAAIWIVVTFNMLITSMAWFNDLANSYSNYAPSIVVIAVILGFGLFYLYFITAVEQHTHGDASDR